jgi:Predicted hydrolases or acyltransferases (alpha/beta hydrolase superfamily)
MRNEDYDGSLVTIAGIPLYYEVAGDGPALVLSHEGLADSSMYDEQFAVLAQSYRVVRYDLPGYGRSGAAKEPFWYHEVLHGLLSYLDIEHVALLGMSLGGGVSLEFALTYPEMTDALILMAAGLPGYPPSPETLQLFAPLQAAFDAGDFVRAIELNEQIWLVGSRRSREDVDPALRERFRSLYTNVLRRSRNKERQGEAVQPPAYQRLSEVHASTLVVVGTGDVPSIQEQAEVLAQSIVGARKVELPDAAHLLNWDYPAEVNQLILDFLHECYPSAQ